MQAIAGDNQFGYSGDGGLADTAELYNPMGVALDQQGNLYIADFGNEDVRMVSAYDLSGVHTSHRNNNDLRTWPEPSNGSFNLCLHSGINAPMMIIVYTVQGQAIKTLSSVTNKNTLIELDVPPATYLVVSVCGANISSREITVK